MANELILVVEDDSKSRKLVRDLLAFKGGRMGGALHALQLTTEVPS